jgi:hypothetical protein
MMPMPKRLHKAADLVDGVLLERLVEHSDQLLEDEQVAFRNMLERGKDLSVPQQEWARKVYDRNGLAKHYPVLKPKKKRPVPTYWWELKENRPLRPPGMK